MRKLLGYRRFQGIAAAQAITRLYGASRLFVNFFQPSFKLAEKHRQGAHVSKRYHPPQTPCDRLLQAENLPEAAKVKLSEVASALDPLKLLEEIRAIQAYLVALADGETLPSVTVDPPDLSAFIASLSSAWRAGETRPTFSVEAKPRYLRGLQRVVQQQVVQLPPKNVSAQMAVSRTVAAQTPPAVTAQKTPERPQLIYAEPGARAFHALTMVWPIVCRRLEGFPNITSTQLFEELCIQFPGRFHPWQVKCLMKRVKVWRQDARARGVVIGRLKYRCVSKKPRGRGPGPQRFMEHWPEMLQYLEARPDLTAVDLLTEFQARYPGFYSASHLRTLRRRLQAWRREACKRLICNMQDHTQEVGSGITQAQHLPPSPWPRRQTGPGNIAGEASGNKIT